MEFPCQILILSEKKQIFDFFLNSLNDLALLKIFNDKEKIPAESKIQFIFTECDYVCSTKKCLKNFLFLLRNSRIPFAIARPILLRKKFDSVRGYILSIYEEYLLSPFQEEILNTIKNYHCSPRLFLHPSNIIYKILEIQREIAENPQKKMTLSSCAGQVNLSPSWLSFKFNEISGISLKGLLLKIKFCYSLWQILSTNEPIKRIALDLGYKPLSFSKRFHSIFGVSPSSIRSKMPSLLI